MNLAFRVQGLVVVWGGRVGRLGFTVGSLSFFGNYGSVFRV